MTQLKAGVQQSLAERSDSPSREPFMLVCLKDNRWVRKQSAIVKDLWLDCWYSDPYGTRWVLLATDMKRESLKKAKKVLRLAGLFDFKTEMRVLAGDRYYETYVINLHGSRTSYVKDVEAQVGMVEPQVGTGIPTSIQGDTEQPQLGIVEPQGGTEKPQVGIPIPGKHLQTPIQQGVQHHSRSSSISIQNPPQSKSARANNQEEEVRFVG